MEPGIRAWHLGLVQTICRMDRWNFPIMEESSRREG